MNNGVAAQRLEVKAQIVRLVDVFLLGPLMIAGAGEGTPLPRVGRLVLAVSGVLTITYNAANFLEIDRRYKSAQANI